ncbi:amidase [Methylobacterium radiotolerans]|jgi:aspartyl-tRNA(Asn)/glutamyl-tRNA(Gln) amidotransferase subunit A|uniref:amidase n=2 Tax=Methylobacteriaceae TaxID=119045 RepID=UPI0005E85216|nr:MULTISPECIES: amidase [Methylobacterium]MBN6823968.1 amidase [Methylobacterium organophilum]OXE42365.1 amidase [Methylobacterium radiotolerans]UIY43844.1 amidase [Methylobacterium radiotolerans]GAN49951.1 amidase [Methylobacterium sp. ME121]
MSVRETVEERLARIAEGDPAVFTRLYAEQARAAADAADARRRDGISLGPLDGAMVSIKDLFDVAGETTRAGSILLADAAPARTDAPVVARLRRAGAVILGKTNMSEFAFSGLGLNPHYGTPGNAADPACIPGGSSSGAGVSVGQGTSDIAIGSDTGGSVRIPASLNGVVGFKPTARRVPLEGAFPLSYALDSLGPLARTVADCAAADAVMAGEEPAPLEALAVAGLRIGVPRGLLFTETEGPVAEAFERVLSRLSRAGARIADHPIDDHLAAMDAALPDGSLAAIEAAAIHADWLDSAADRYDPRVHRRIVAGRGATAAGYIRTMRRRAALIAAFDRYLAPLDVLALPATATTAPLTAPLAADDAAFLAANRLMLRNTAFGNFFDLTGLSLPMPDLPRPAGLMLLARHGQDRRLLAIGAGIEAALAG